ncbi:MAG TPA: nucleotide pyrophosphohydrolase [Bacilli bacterium]|jgi:NTP pyrophosphatase (non-canonical NTP hydrolase)|nr:nucleotide pyrophosphohydrolase [Acholeplasmataceae bacterium]HNZ77214.1 nucleotide pyrophosphohydrolase [Bacilli bacterium]HOD61247.1 nucleotide pyrophosphohydrolase [Bacilli bacterium]HOE06831.1 nucleotide pyrophosphohydrolase [Bacilli bacterium]HOH61499.1 nucleotide pyrophosphohydrolase [Bacilli bacterium]
MNEKIISLINNFVRERNWEQFHTGSNLAKSLVLEACELLELYQWSDEVENVNRLADELADVFVYCIQIAEKYKLNIEEIIINKMKKNEEKYPVSLAKNSSKKYNKLTK